MYEIIVLGKKCQVVHLSSSMRLSLTWSSTVFWFFSSFCEFHTLPIFPWQESYFSIFVPLWQGLVLRFSTNDADGRTVIWIVHSKALFHQGFLCSAHPYGLWQKPLSGPCHISFVFFTFRVLNQLSNCLFLTIHNTPPFLPTTLTYLVSWVQKVW